MTCPQQMMQRRERMTQTVDPLTDRNALRERVATVGGQCLCCGSISPCGNISPSAPCPLRHLATRPSGSGATGPATGRSCWTRRFVPSLASAGPAGGPNPRGLARLPYCDEVVVTFAPHSNTVMREAGGRKTIRLRIGREPGALRDVGRN